MITKKLSLMTLTLWNDIPWGSGDWSFINWNNIDWDRLDPVTFFNILYYCTCDTQVTKLLEGNAKKLGFFVEEHGKYAPNDKLLNIVKQYLIQK